MKGLLYKEFASRKSLLLLLLSLLAAMTALAAVTGYGASEGTIWLFSLVLPAYGLELDKRSGWNKFSRALPQTAHKQVGAQYAVWFTAIVITFFAATAITAIGTNFDMQRYDLMQVPYPWKDMFWSRVRLDILTFCFMTVFLAIHLLLNYLLIKRAVRIALITVIVGLGYVSWSVFLGHLKNSYFVYMHFSPSVTVMIAAAALMLFAASYLFAVIAETKSGKEKLKSTKAAAVVLVAGALVASGITVYALDRKGAFDVRDNTYERIIGSVPDDELSVRDKLALADAIIAKEEARKDVAELIDVICGKTFAGKTRQDIEVEYKKSGSEDDWKIISSYLETVDSEVISDDFVYYNDDIGNTVFDSADESQLNAIESSFSVGMSERDAVDVMKAVDFYPQSITETLDKGKTRRTYRGGFLIESYENGERIIFSLNIEIADGTVSEVRTYIR